MKISDTKGVSVLKASKVANQSKDTTPLYGYDIDEYMNKALGSNKSDDMEISNLEIPHELKDLFRRKTAGIFDQLMDAQAGPFAVYNNPPPLGASGVVHTPEPQQMMAPTPPPAVASVPMVPPPSVNVQVPMVPTQPVIVPEVPMVNEVHPGMPMGGMGHDLGTAPAIVPAQSSSQVAGVPIVNVVGGRNISAPGVLSAEEMENQRLLNSKSHESSGFHRLNIDSIGKILIVSTIVVFLLAGCIMRIKSRRKQTKKR
ncbi:conserved hypothetical protein [Theileria equi strain WA]|uniref:Uncharacterized protein n=1 Tax=Theileria equi strain WA TaxID=1537102 RepID=L1LD55_THEEQ|nr:conserved hypothetical protein [Theileria equi strain WA]EKX73185.1 conserved hypothetical protein [Theileria equi strain WA]|eukprot:XP_004832637.1 conserved hypothetical protein [Theileria equi strain WA]